MGSWGFLGWTSGGLFGACTRYDVVIIILHYTPPALVCVFAGFLMFHSVSDILERDGVPEQLLRTTRSPLFKGQNLLLNSLYHNSLFDLRPANHVLNIYLSVDPGEPPHDPMSQ